MAKRKKPVSGVADEVIGKLCKAESICAAYEVIVSNRDADAKRIVDRWLTVESYYRLANYQSIPSHIMAEYLGKRCGGLVIRQLFDLLSDLKMDTGKRFWDKHINDIQVGVAFLGVLEGHREGGIEEREINKEDVLERLTSWLEDHGEDDLDEEDERELVWRAVSKVEHLISLAWGHWQRQKFEKRRLAA